MSGDSKPRKKRVQIEKGEERTPGETSPWGVGGGE